jgi:hypothetical protein
MKIQNIWEVTMNEDSIAMVMEMETHLLLLEMEMALLACMEKENTTSCET